jgi:hypothetical protein
VSNNLSEWKGSVDWLCEKWSEEACDYVRSRLIADGISHIQDGYLIAPVGLRDRAASFIAGRDVSQAVLVPRFIPVEAGVTSEVLRRYVGAPEEVLEVPGNLLLNEGIQKLLDIAIAAVSNQTTGNRWNAADSYIGVGDSAVAEAATQAELQAATNRFYKGMNATFPSRASQTVTWQSDFVTAEANYVWAEWTVSSGATVASGGGFTTGTTNLNRKVSALGTKTTGTWTLSCSITLS